MENDKDRQGGIHTHFGNRIVDRQTKEFVIVGRRGLDCKYNQEEDKYKHHNAMLIQWNEETEHLEEICTIKHYHIWLKSPMDVFHKKVKNIVFVEKEFKFLENFEKFPRHSSL